MKTFACRLARWLPSAGLVLTLSLALPAPALALDRGPYSVELLVDGVPLEEHAARGRTYVEALEGREYSIRLSNHTRERVAVALSVDGLNTIDAKTTPARDASKWILRPYETITLDGWQTGPSTARRFFFTTEERSYGAWLGKTDNLGVIAAAVFRERRPKTLHRRPISKHGARSGGERAPTESPRREAAGRDDDAAAPKSPTSAAEPTVPELSDDLAATGIGRELDHRVRRVRFNAEKSPAAVLQIRYEYHDALVRLGVLPPAYAYREDPLERRERSRGFEDMEFAPDPYRYREHPR